MKAFSALVLTAAVATAHAQSGATPSTEIPDSTLRLINEASMKAGSALKHGKAVTITVDNRSVAFAPKLIRGMVYVPVRFFQETGQRVIWDAQNMRATLRQETGPRKNAIEFGVDSDPAGKSMRPVMQAGRLYVPLATGLGAFNLVADWVPTSNRINVRTNRR